MSILLSSPSSADVIELNPAPDCVRLQPSEDSCHSRLSRLTPSLFQFPLGLIFSFFWSPWHGVIFSSFLCHLLFSLAWCLWLYSLFDLRFWESDFVLGFHRFSMYLSAKYSVLI